MNSIKKILLGAALWCGVFAARAAGDSTGIYVREVLRPQAEGMRSTALQRLGALGQPVSYPLLEAVNSSNLYVLGDKAVTLGSAGNGAAAQGDPRAVYEVYPDQR